MFISNKWVYTKKQSFLNQTTLRYKERLISKDFAYKESINYNEVFSLIIKHAFIFILLAFVVEYELELTQLDVKTVFLHEDLKKEIRTSQPCGFKVARKEHARILIKSLYRLKQLSRQ